MRTLQELRKELQYRQARILYLGKIIETQKARLIEQEKTLNVIDQEWIIITDEILEEQERLKRERLIDITLFSIGFACIGYTFSVLLNYFLYV